MSEKLNSTEIINLLENLIGPIKAIGDSAIDAEIMKNLKTLIGVIDWCLDAVRQSACTRRRPEHSMRVIGETANAALNEWQEWLIEEDR